VWALLCMLQNSNFPQAANADGTKLTSTRPTGSPAGRPHQEKPFMFDHISIGVRDVAKAKAFYDAALKPLGLTCLSADETSLGYGKDAARFWVNAAEHPVPADPKSGLHFCFTAPSRESVEAFHKAAMAHGGRDNGKPGLRKDYGPHYYAAFVHDPEGYRLEAYYSGK
jgi:catechol 2,3-dioxygenase-like lactoylglutathione lyase family enzyme